MHFRFDTKSVPSVQYPHAVVFKQDLVKGWELLRPHLQPYQSSFSADHDFRSNVCHDTHGSLQRQLRAYHLVAVGYHFSRHHFPSGALCANQTELPRLYRLNPVWCSWQKCSGEVSAPLWQSPLRASQSCPERVASRRGGQASHSDVTCPHHGQWRCANTHRTDQIVLTAFAWGTMSHEQSLNSLRLFVAEVMSDFKDNPQAIID